MPHLKKSKTVIRVSYRPEQQVCPACQSKLKRDHIVWRKYLIFSNAALIDPAKSLEELLARMEEVDQEEFLNERKRLNLSLLDEAKIHRFRHQRADFLAELEARWEAALAEAKTARK